MTVAELIAQLQTLPGDLPVVMSKDSEGNSFSPMHEAEVARYFAECTWAGEIVHPDDDADYVNLEDVVCLWPVS